LELLANRVHFLGLLFSLVSLSAVAATPDINIEGGTSALRTNILQQLSIANEQCKAPAWRLNAHLDASESEITAAAQALGYYHLTYETQLTRNKNCWALKIQLTPGEPTRVTELRIDIMGDGRLDPLFQKIYDKPGIKIGSKFHHGKYETLKTRFESAATAHGYFDAQFALSRVLINEAEKSAVIELIYDTGKRYTLGEINIAQDVLHQDIVQRYLNIQTGDLYDTDELLELKNLYNASNYYGGTSITPDMDHKENNQININIDLEKRKRHEYSIGGGYATDTGPRILLGFEDRYINKKGHYFNADISASETKKEAQLVYTIPMKKPAFEFLKLFTGYEREETDSSFSRKKSIGSSYTYYQKSKWLQTYAIQFEHEDSIVGEQPLTITDLIIPSWTISRIKTDAAAYPLNGWSIVSRLSGSPQSLGSDFSFVQWDTRLKHIWGGDYGRLILRSHLGYTETVDFDELPASVRYFTGGDASVRGYDYESLGATEKDAEGNDLVIGGKNLVVASVEYDHVIGDSNWVMAAFYDQGNSSNDLNFDFKSSVGLGIRWISPIGPIRVDLAKALDDEKSWAVHVTMGPDL
jgi:translocation and assembly module TamA